MATAQAPADSELGFPPKGALKRVPFPRLIREISQAQLSGSLYLLNGQTKKVVFFELGHPVFVRSNVLSECLGQILASEGLITQEQCEQTLEAIRRTGKKQGELLVEMGILSEGNLRYALEAQLRAKLFDIFAWDGGRYQFKVDNQSQQFGIRLQASAAGMVVAAIVDRYSEERAEQLLRPHMSRYVASVEPFATFGDLELLPEEQYFVDCLDGSQTVGQYLAAPPIEDVPTPVVFLYGLVAAGVAELSDTPADAKTRRPPPRIRSEGADSQYAPDFEAHTQITEYEDTPLPGELPTGRPILGEHEADFGDVEESGIHNGPEFRQRLVAAEPETIDETFEDGDIELSEDELEIVDIPAKPLTAIREPTQPDELDPFDSPTIQTPSVPLPEPSESLADSALSDPGLQTPANAGAPHAHPVAHAEIDNDPTRALLLEGDDDLLLDNELDQIDLGDLGEFESSAADLAELDDIDLAPSPADSVPQAPIVGAMDFVDNLEEAGLPAPPAGVGPAVDNPEKTAPDIEESGEMTGALRFNEAETAMNDSNFAGAVSLLEDAYEHGFDVAELHAMLAYARFRAANGTPEAARHAFELLDYAQTMDPSLDMVHAYRGAIYNSIQEPARAREALDRALELNPYCELAMELMDSLR